jgi:PRD1 phage membrane DNA delivery
MDKLTEAGLSLGALIVGVAVLSIILSQRSNTTGVIQSLASGFGNSLAVAESPVTGTSVQPDLSYPGGGSFNHLFGNFQTMGLP